MNTEAFNVAGAPNPTWGVPPVNAANAAGSTALPFAGQNASRRVEQRPAEPSQAGFDREQRFNELISDHMGDLYKYAYWMSGNRSVAEDVTQETLVRAWNSIDRLKNPNAAKGWLLTIARRENARYFEGKRLQTGELSEEALADQRIDYDTSTEAFVLRRALQRLPQDYREPLLLQVVYGYSSKEIAAQLDLSEAAVNTRLFRARSKMRELLVAQRDAQARGL